MGRGMARRGDEVTTQGKGTPKCSRCARRWRGHGEWNMTMVRGRVAGLLCPSCQTPEENAEAEINFATLDYAMNAHGQLTARPKMATA